MIKRYALVAGLLALILLGLYLYLRVRYGRPRTLNVPAVSSAVLPKDDREQIIVDPVRHNLIIVRPTGNETISLPDRPTTIDIKKDNTVRVIAPQWGYEHRAFAGLYASDRLRVAGGVDGLYFKRFDLGAGIASSVDRLSVVGFGVLSYNFYSNCRVGITYGTDRRVGAVITVRI